MLKLRRAAALPGAPPAFVPSEEDRKMARKIVQVGQVYQVAGSPTGRTWRVRSTVDLFGITHARVVSTDDEGETKTLSCQVLADPDFYRMVDAGPAVTKHGTGEAA
jgi:hypothetical protein